MSIIISIIDFFKVVLSCFVATILIGLLVATSFACWLVCKLLDCQIVLSCRQYRNGLPELEYINAIINKGEENK